MSQVTGLSRFDDTLPARPSVVWYPVLVLTTAALAAALTITYRCMRSVMLVGGACGSSRTYQIQTPCPKGIPLMINLAIWGGLIAAAVMALAARQLAAPNLVWLAWPALFLSLGFNFLQFGLDPPGGGGAQIGWLVCAVVFGLMGGVPLLLALPRLWRHPDAPQRLAGRALAATTAMRNLATPPNVVVSPRFSPQGPGVGSPLVGELERLAALHASGAITDTEFQTAKQSLLGTGR